MGGLSAGVALAAIGAQAVLAHGATPPEPSLATVVTAWSADPLPWLGVATATVAYLTLVMVVNRAHPATRVPRWRVAAWLAGVAVIAIALSSAIDVYAESVFSVHMVQHLLLARVAGAPMARSGGATMARSRCCTMCTLKTESA